MKSYSTHAYFKEKVVVTNVLLKMPTPLAVAPLNTDDLVHLIYHCYRWVQILLKSPISTLLFFFFPHSWTQPGILNRSPKLQVFYAKEEEIPLSVHCKFSHQLWFGKRFFVSYLERLKSYWNLQGACAISQSNHSISLMTRTLCYLDQQMCSVQLCLASILSWYNAVLSHWVRQKHLNPQTWWASTYPYAHSVMSG